MRLTFSSQSGGMGNARSRMAQGSAVIDHCRWTIPTSVAPLGGGSPAWAALGRMGLILKVCPRYAGPDIPLTVS